jgi:hypothetical protein
MDEAVAFAPVEIGAAELVGLRATPAIAARSTNPQGTECPGTANRSSRTAGARAAGVPEVVLCGDGDLVQLAPDRAGVIDEVPAARLYKAGALLISAEARTVADRRRSSFSGIVIVALAVSEKGRAARRSGRRADRHSGVQRRQAADAGCRPRCGARHVRVVAQAAAARSAGGGGGGEARGAVDDRGAAGQEAGTSGAGDHGAGGAVLYPEWSAASPAFGRPAAHMVEFLIGPGTDVASLATALVAAMEP